MRVLFLFVLEQIENLSERELLANFYEEHKLFVCKIVLSRYKVLKYELDDIVSDVFLKVLLHRARILNTDTNEAMRMLIIITNSVCIDRIRKQNSSPQVNLKTPLNEKTIPDESESEDKVFDGLWRKESAEALKNALAELSDIERNVVLCKYITGLTYKEIAALMNISVTNVGTLLNRALKKLRSEMEDRLNDEQQSKL